MFWCTNLQRRPLAFRISCIIIIVPIEQWNNISSAVALLFIGPGVVSSYHINRTSHSAVDGTLIQMTQIKRTHANNFCSYLLITNTMRFVRIGLKPNICRIYRMYCYTLACGTWKNFHGAWKELTIGHWVINS